MESKRISDIRYFLAHYAQLYATNPNFNIVKDTFKFGLETYPYPLEEVQKSKLSSQFGKWKAKLKNLKNFELKDISFLKKDDDKMLKISNTSNDKDGIDLAISPEANSVDMIVENLHLFMDINNIEFKSCVTNKLRSDTITIRVFSMADAKKIASYINNNEIGKHIKPGNPFMTNMGSVGISFNGSMNYYNILSDIMTNYFQEKRKTNALNTVSYEDFVAYVRKYHVKNFKFVDNFKSFVSNVITPKKSKNKNEAELINEYDSIIDFIECGLDDTKGPAEFENLFNQHRVNKSRLVKYYDEVLTTNYTGLAGYNNCNKTQIELFNNYIGFSLIEYGRDDTIEGLKAFLNGDVYVITRSYGYRDFFSKMLDANTMMAICNNNIASYVDSYASRFNFKETKSKPQVEQVKQGIDEVKYNKFLEAVDFTKKMGFLPKAIKEGLRGNYSFFTKYEKDMASMMTGIFDFRDCVTKYLESKGIQAPVDNDEKIVETFENMQNEKENTFLEAVYNVVTMGTSLSKAIKEGMRGNYVFFGKKYEAILKTVMESPLDFNRCVNNYLRSKNITINDYNEHQIPEMFEQAMYADLKSKAKEEQQPQNKGFSNEQYDILMRALELACKNYGVNHAVQAFEKVVKENDYGWFSREFSDHSKCRNRLKELVKPNEFVDLAISYLEKMGYDPKFLTQDVVPATIASIAEDNIKKKETTL